MAILLKCASRKHTLRLNPKRFWKKTLCPQCKLPVDPIRLRRAMKFPSVIFDKDFEIFPPFVKRSIVPILGLIMLIVGLALTFINWPRNNGQIASNTSTPTVAESKPNEVLTSNPSNSIGDQSNKSNTVASILPTILQPASGTNSSTNLATSETPNLSYSIPVSKTAITTLSPTPLLETVRYPSGTNLMRPENGGGRAYLQISNGTAFDAIAKLVDSASNKTCRLVYIQDSSTATISGIRSGEYTLKFALGSGYNKDSNSFLNNQSFSKFDETMDFREFRTDNRVRWHNGKVTLNPVEGGTASTSSISVTDFEDH